MKNSPLKEPIIVFTFAPANPQHVLPQFLDNKFCYYSFRGRMARLAEVVHKQFSSSTWLGTFDKQQLKVSEMINYIERVATIFLSRQSPPEPDRQPPLSITPSQLWAKNHVSTIPRVAGCLRKTFRREK